MANDADSSTKPSSDCEGDSDGEDFTDDWGMWLPPAHCEDCQGCLQSQFLVKTLENHNLNVLEDLDPNNPYSKAPYVADYQDV